MTNTYQYIAIPIKFISDSEFIFLALFAFIMSGTEKQSRYEKLLELTSKSIKKSHDSIDKKVAIEECYGTDASIFGDSKEAGTKVLEQLLEQTLEEIDSDVKAVIQEAIRKHDVKSQLDLLDSVLEDFRRVQREKQEQEDTDKDSAQDAITKSKLPNGVSLAQVLQYRAYLARTKYRDDLVSQIEMESKKNEDLQEKINQEKELANDDTSNLNNYANDLGRAADICSFNGVS